MKKSISIIISLLLAIPIWSRDYNIVTQGKAIGDGKTLNTKIIQSWRKTAPKSSVDNFDTFMDGYFAKEK